MKVTIVPCVRDGWIADAYGEIRPTVIIAVRIEDEDSLGVSEEALVFDEVPRTFALTADYPDDWLKIGSLGCAIRTDHRVCFSKENAIEVARSRASDKYEKLLNGGR